MLLDSSKICSCVIKCPENISNNNIHVVKTNQNTTQHGTFESTFETPHWLRVKRFVSNV